MKKRLIIIFTACLFVFTIPKKAEAQRHDHSVVVSPMSLFLGTLNTRYEALSGKKLTIGGRLEYDIAYSSLMILPTGRIYPFTKDAEGLYLEGSAGFRTSWGEFWEDWGDIAFVNFSPQVRLALGGQWFLGKKNNLPLDINFGINVDPLIGSFEQEGQDAGVDGGGVLLGAFLRPVSVLKFRLQMGYAF